MLASLFYARMANACRQAGFTVKMHPSCIMAQVANETGYTIGPNLNVTNIKLFGKGTGYQSGSYLLNNDVITGGPMIAYEKYASLEQWGKAYVHVLQGSLYSKCHGLPTTEDTCHALGNSKFAESGYRYGSVKEGWRGTRGQVLIDMIKANNLKKYDSYYNPKGSTTAHTAPVKTADNTKAVTDALAKKKADDLAKAKIADAMHAQDVKEELDDNKAIAKAKLTNDAKKLAQAQALAKANATKRAQALAQAKAQKIATDKANALKTATAYKSNNPANNTPSTPTASANKTLPSKLKDYSKNKVLGSGLSVFGAIAILVFIGNGFIPKETLE